MGLKRYQLLALGGKLLEISGNSFAVCTVLVQCLLFSSYSFSKFRLSIAFHCSANHKCIKQMNFRQIPLWTFRNTLNCSLLLITRLTVRLIKMQFLHTKKHQKRNTLSQLIIIWSEASTNATKWEKVYDHLSSFRIIFLWFFRSPSMRESPVLRCVLAISITVHCWQRQSACCSLSALLWVCVGLFLVHQFATITIRQKYKNVPNGLVKKINNQNWHDCCIIKWKTKTKCEHERQTERKNPI